MLDESLAKLLKGMQSLDHVKAIIYKNNDFQQLSLSALSPLLTRRKPNNLEELRLVSCRIGGCITHGLIEELLNGSNIKKLGLVQANMSSVSFKNLCLYVKKSRTLRELDLSYNEVPMRLMSQMIEVI